MPAVSTAEVAINYEFRRRGSEAAVLINGLGDSLETWQSLWEFLSDAGYSVVRLDNRGVGKSSAPPGPYDIATMAADVKTVCDELGLENFHLIGASMGGAIAQEYACNYASDLASLTLMCTPPKTEPWLAFVLEAWRRTAVESGVQRAVYTGLNWVLSPHFFNHRAADLEGLVAEFYASEPQPLEGFLGQVDALLAYDGSARLSAIKVPTHVVLGEQDILIPAELARSACGVIEGAELSVCPGAHGFLWECPDECHVTIRDFLDRHPGRRPASAVSVPGT